MPPKRALSQPPVLPRLTRATAWRDEYHRITTRYLGFINGFPSIPEEPNLIGPPQDWNAGYRRGLLATRAFVLNTNTPLSEVSNLIAQLWDLFETIIRARNRIVGAETVADIRRIHAVRDSYDPANLREHALSLISAWAALALNPHLRTTSLVLYRLGVTLRWELSERIEHYWNEHNYPTILDENDHSQVVGSFRAQLSSIAADCQRAAPNIRPVTPEVRNALLAGLRESLEFYRDSPNPFLDRAARARAAGAVSNATRDLWMLLNTFFQSGGPNNTGFYHDVVTFLRRLVEIYETTLSFMDINETFREVYPLWLQILGLPTLAVDAQLEYSMGVLLHWPTVPQGVTQPPNWQGPYSVVTPYVAISSSESGQGSDINPGLDGAGDQLTGWSLIRSGLHQQPLTTDMEGVVAATNAGKLKCIICAKAVQLGDQVVSLRPHCRHWFHPRCLDSLMPQFTEHCPVCGIHVKPGGN